MGMVGLITEEWVVERADQITDWRFWVWPRLPEFSIDFLNQFSDEINLSSYFCHLCMCKSREKEMRRVAALLKVKYICNEQGETPWAIALNSYNIIAIKFLIECDSYGDVGESRKIFKSILHALSDKEYINKYDRLVFNKCKKCLSYLTKVEKLKKWKKNIQKNGI